MEKIVTFSTGKSDFKFNFNNLSLLNDLLFDSQFNVPKTGHKLFNNVLVLELKRPDYNRKKIINFYFFKICLVKETFSSLCIKNVNTFNFVIKDLMYENDKSDTIFSIFSIDDETIIFETEKHIISINGPIEFTLKDKKLSKKNYLIIFNSNGLDFPKWVKEYERIEGNS